MLLIILYFIIVMNIILDYFYFSIYYLFYPLGGRHCLEAAGQ